MRMWMVDPRILCAKHLLGEHVEMHMFMGSIKKGKSIAGYIKKGLCDPSRIIERHNALAKEMESRGMNHKSPLGSIDDTFHEILNEKHPVNLKESTIDLINRCDECRKLFLEYRDGMEDDLDEDYREALKTKKNFEA